ncbi:hypothetical protein P43SY_002468 [Pythium insidiosum]|uniref:Ligatin n=1 Tax=Pythium insidiosum TaxID=114742 RepID=A0AAD5LBN3_PYTIN|nr:hypothetical protein P43SY_002468 [Pythium insidiosum]
MFAKPHKTSGSSLLKNKDIKKLRRDVASAAGEHAADRESALDCAALLSTKATLKRVSFQAPSRTVVFVNDDTREPLAFDLSGGRGGGDALGVSLYALWREPSLLPPLTVHAPVSQFVLRGADVMLPGVVFTSPREIESLRVGEWRAVYARGNPHAFAVGELLVDAAALAAHGKQGRALRLVHVYGDELWRMGPQTAPNEGFPPPATMAAGGASKNAVVRPLSAAGDAVEEEDEDEEEGEEEKEAANSSGGDDGEENDDDLLKLSDVLLGGDDDDDEEEEEHEEKTETEKDGDRDETHEVSRSDMDELYRCTLLQALRSGKVKDKQLPMLASTFHAAVLLPSRPADVSLNIKQTTHRKLSVFLKAMAQRGLLHVSEKDGEARAASGLGVQAAPAPGTFAPDVQEFFGLSQALRTLLSHDPTHAEAFAPALRQRHFTAPQVRELIAQYVEREALVDPLDKRFVRLNGPLTDAFFFGNKQSAYPDRVQRADLLKILLDKCPRYHRICLFPGHDAKMRSGGLRRIEISADKSKRHANSTITTVAFYEPFGIDGAAFAREAQKRWGCHATTQRSEDKAKGEEIKVQGQMVSEVLDFLASRYKIATAKCCDVRYGKNVKPKKKK